MTHTELEIIIAGEGGIKNVAKAIHEAHLKECILFWKWCKKEEDNDRLATYEEDCFYGIISKYDNVDKPLTYEQLFELYERSKTK